MSFSCIHWPSIVQWSQLDKVSSYFLHDSKRALFTVIFENFWTCFYSCIPLYLEMSHLSPFLKIGESKEVFLAVGKVPRCNEQLHNFDNGTKLVALHLFSKHYGIPSGPGDAVYLSFRKVLRTWSSVIPKIPKSMVCDGVLRKLSTTWDDQTSH